MRVLPTGIDFSRFSSERHAKQLPSAKGFNFLAVTNLHDRQGCEMLVDAFLSEFHADEDVALWLKLAPHRQPQSSDVRAELAFFMERKTGLTLDRCPTILLIDEDLPSAMMDRLYACADAFVRPSHGSAFGVAVLEALSSGLPVIATRWGPALDFLHDQNSYLIDVERLVPAKLDREFTTGQLWAQPSREHLRQLMRRVFSFRDEARERGRIGRRQMKEHRDWNRLFPQWLDAFQELLQ
jgi:glycosyltransferase involved in cell wall biosynthesis